MGSASWSLALTCTSQSYISTRPRIIIPPWPLSKAVSLMCQGTDGQLFLVFIQTWLICSNFDVSSHVLPSRYIFFSFFKRGDIFTLKMWWPMDVAPHTQLNAHKALLKAHIFLMILNCVIMKIKIKNFIKDDIFITVQHQKISNFF